MNTLLDWIELSILQMYIWLSEYILEHMDLSAD